MIVDDTNLLDLDMAVWERTLRVGVTGYAYLIRAALPHMLAAGKGTIVCTSSDASSIGEPVRPAYGVTKAGVNALVRHVASRWGREGVRANAICPFAVSETLRAHMPQETLDEWRAGLRTDHFAEPAEMAPAVAFLLSDDASYVNGQIWSVNGGQTLRG